MVSFKLLATQGSVQINSSRKRKKTHIGDSPSLNTDTAMISGGDISAIVTPTNGAGITTARGSSQATPLVAAGSSKKAPSVNQILMGPTKRQLLFANTDVMKMEVGTFLVKCSKGHIDWNQSYERLGLGGSSGKQLKNKVKEVYTLAMNYATSNEKATLTQMPVPFGTDEKYQAYDSDINAAALSVAKKLFQSLKDKHSVQFGDNKFTIQKVGKMTITSAYNMNRKLK